MVTLDITLIGSPLMVLNGLFEMKTASDILYIDVTEQDGLDYAKFIDVL